MYIIISSYTVPNTELCVSGRLNLINSNSNSEQCVSYHVLIIMVLDRIRSNVCVEFMDIYSTYIIMKV